MCFRNTNSYIICKEKIGRYTNSVDIGINDLKFQYSNGPVFKKKSNKKSFILFGRFCDCEKPFVSEDDIVDELWESRNIDELIKKSKSLAGRFLIIAVFLDHLFIVPDATVTIPVSFTKYGELCVSSNPNIIAKLFDLNESPISKKIKSKASPNQPLPYDLTMYEDIKRMPPNHYLHCNKREVIRYFPSNKLESINVQDAVTESSRLLNNILGNFKQKYKLSIPITSGLDSRTILSLSKNFIDEIPTYTFFHRRFTNKTGDVYIPQMMAKDLGFNHKLLFHSELPQEIYQKCQEEIGGIISPDELQNVWTYRNSQISNYIRLDGNVSPLGKSNFGRNLPEALATPSYLVTKTHNYAKENRREIKRWYKDVKDICKKSGVSKYDLFFWEHRSGNWTTNSLKNSDLFVDSLNIFNCRLLLEMWLRVPRKQRMDGAIHKGIINLNWSELLDYPFNPGQKYKILYNNSILYYVAVKAKYFLESFKY